MTSKVCNRCGAEKLLTDFSKHIRRPDGYQGECKLCKKEWNKRSNSGAYKGYYNARKRSLLSDEELFDCLTQAEVIEETRAIYEERDRLNAEAGNCNAWHIDHIVPISQGGKHRAYNLRLLPGGENVSRWHNERGQDIDYATEHMDDEQLEAYELALVAQMKEAEEWPWQDSGIEE